MWWRNAPGGPNGRPEEVWNCRCTLVAVVAGIDPNIPLSGRANKLGDMSYDEWRSEHSKSATGQNNGQKKVTSGGSSTRTRLEK